jgi:transposase
MGNRKQDEQPSFWSPTHKLVQSAGHPFYRRLNEILSDGGFDRFAESQCVKFYAEGRGRRSIPPGVYFRMLMVGYFEGIDSERGIAWRCEDSLALRGFLGYGLDESTPDHSSLSRIRHRIDLETHREVFTWVLGLLAKEKLVDGKAIGIDATTLEANAAMRSIVRRDTGESYEDFLKQLAKESGIETPTREELTRLDKKRKKKTSNDDWQNPHDPDAKITKMKDKRTHLANKSEHAVDLDSGTILSVTVQGGDLGDTTTIHETLSEAIENLADVAEGAEAPEVLGDEAVRKIVADKGYHSAQVLTDLSDMGIKTYIPERDIGRRRWRGRTRHQAAVYGNRRRMKRAHGKSLLRKRAELVERSFAHVYDRGGMRRTHLRGHNNILKRLMIHVCGFNLGLLMRKVFGCGTPKGHSGLISALFFVIYGLPTVVMRKIDRFVAGDRRLRVMSTAHAVA